MSLTITLVAGTGWPPSQAADDCVKAAFAEFGSWIVGTNTVEVKVNWANISPVAGSVSLTETDTDYATTKALLLAQSDALTNSIKSTAYATLPGSNPAGAPSTYRNNTIWNAILNNTNFTTQIGQRNEITFDSSGPTFDTDSTYPLSCTGGAYGMYQASLHEFRELAGGFSRLVSSSTASAIDLFSYSSSGTRCFTAANRYFSWDDGVTNLGAWGSSSDLVDWAGQETGEGYQGTSTASPFGSSGVPGDPQLIRYIDVQTLSAMGLPLTSLGLKAAGLPFNTVAPIISGTQIVGNDLTVSTAGTWVGQSTITKTYQWQRNGSDIGGATGSTYTLVSADAGTNLTAVETGTNIIGAQTATSNSLAISASSRGSRSQLFSHA